MLHSPHIRSAQRLHRADAQPELNEHWGNSGNSFKSVLSEIPGQGHVPAGMRRASHSLSHHGLQFSLGGEAVESNRCWVMGWLERQTCPLRISSLLCSNRQGSQPRMQDESQDQCIHKLSGNSEQASQFPRFSVSSSVKWGKYSTLLPENCDDNMRLCL